MASLLWTARRLLLPRRTPQDASLTVPWCCSAPFRIASRGLATSKAKTTPRSRNKAKDAEKQAGQDPRLPVLSLASLRDLALLCGRNSSGTRAVLRADLEASMAEDMNIASLTSRTAASRPAMPQRILSIDMGVRNLAYCLLQVDAETSPSSGRRPVLQLLAWERLSLIGGEQGPSDGEAATAKATAAAAAAAAATGSGKPSASAFSPPAMAAVAARLIRDRLLPLAPTHVLIERQRFRSGGGAAVLEWTVRVNSLEAMLHGILAYHQQLHSGKMNNKSRLFQTIQAVSPRRVSQFLLRGGLSSGKEAQKPDLSVKVTKEKDIKDVKEAFVAGILRASETERRVTYTESISHIVDAYLLRWDAKQSKSRHKTKKQEPEDDDGTDTLATPKPVFSKIDDMADCVTQGLAWLEWEDNKKILQTRGAEGLLAAKKIAA